MRAGLDRLGRPYADVDNPLTADAGPLDLPAADPYPGLRAVTAGYLRVLKAYDNVVYHRSGTALFSHERRDDVTAVRAAADALRAFHQHGPDSAARGDLNATLAHLGGLLEACARTTRMLQANLDAQGRRAPKFRPILDQFADTALAEAARMAATVTAGDLPGSRPQASAPAAEPASAPADVAVPDGAATPGPGQAASSPPPSRETPASPGTPPEPPQGDPAATPGDQPDPDTPADAGHGREPQPAGGHTAAGPRPGTGPQGPAPGPAPPGPAPSAGAGAVIPSVTVLNGHDREQDAYLIADYPYGRQLRCQKKIWREQAGKGQYKGQWRSVYRTTDPRAATERWNQPKASTYSAMVILYLDGIDHDGQGTQHAETRAIGIYGPSPALDALIRSDGTYEQLAGDDRARYDALAGRGRRNQDYGQWDAAVTFMTARFAEAGTLPGIAEVRQAAGPLNQHSYDVASLIVRHNAATATAAAQAGVGEAAAARPEPASGPQADPATPGKTPETGQAGHGAGPAASAGSSGVASGPAADSPPAADTAAHDPAGPARELAVAVASPDPPPPPGEPARQDGAMTAPIWEAARIAASAAAEHGCTYYVYRDPSDGDIQRCVITAATPHTAGFLAVTAAGQWTETWRGQERQLHPGPRERLEPDYPVTLTEARALARACRLETCISRVGGRAFVSLSEPATLLQDRGSGETVPGAPAVSFEHGTRDVFAGRGARTPAAAITWLAAYRRAADERADSDIFTASTASGWARRLASLVPHLMAGPDYERGVAENLASAIGSARRGDHAEAERQLRRAEAASPGLELAPARAAAIAGRIAADAARYAITGDPARYIAEVMQATSREWDWIGQRIAADPRLTGQHPGATSASADRAGQARADVEARTAEAKALLSRARAAYDQGRLGEAAALVDDAEVLDPIRASTCDRARQLIAEAAAGGVPRHGEAAPAPGPQDAAAAGSGVTRLVPQDSGGAPAAATAPAADPADKGQASTQPGAAARSEPDGAAPAPPGTAAGPAVLPAGSEVRARPGSSDREETITVISGPHQFAPDLPPYYVGETTPGQRCTFTPGSVTTILRPGPPGPPGIRAPGRSGRRRGGGTRLGQSAGRRADRCTGPRRDAGRADPGRRHAAEPGCHGHGRRPGSGRAQAGAAGQPFHLAGPGGALGVRRACRSARPGSDGHPADPGPPGHRGRICRRPGSPGEGRGPGGGRPGTGGGSRAPRGQQGRDQACALHEQHGHRGGSRTLARPSGPRPGHPHPGRARSLG